MHRRTAPSRCSPAALLPAAASAQTMTEPPGRAGHRRLQRMARPDLLGGAAQRADAGARVAILERIVATDYIQHNPLVPQGRQGLVDFIPVIYQAMPDAALHPARRLRHRRPRGDALDLDRHADRAGFLGIAPRGQQLEFDVIDLWTVQDGQLYEHWDQFDWPRAFVQLGVTGLPQPFRDVAAQPVRR